MSEKIKCIKCGSAEHIVDYEKGYFDCEYCDLQFKIQIINKKKVTE